MNHTDSGISVTRNTLHGKHKTVCGSCQVRGICYASIADCRIVILGSTQNYTERFLYSNQQVDQDDTTAYKFNYDY